MLCDRLGLDNVPRKHKSLHPELFSVADRFLLLCQLPLSVYGLMSRRTVSWAHIGGEAWRDQKIMSVLSVRRDTLVT